MKRISILLLLSGLLVPPIPAADFKEPVYVYLYAKVTDHVNLTVSEDQLRRLLPLIERYRQEHPQVHISATVLFSGAISQALLQRNGKTHIRDFVLDYIRRGIIEAGYDGTDEPTYQNRPVLDLADAATPQERWQLRWAAEKKFLTEGRDPLTGAPVPGATGGYKKMQEVFGDPACITGLTLPMKTGPGNTPGGAVTQAKPAPDESGKVRPAPNPGGLKPEVGGDTEAVQLLRLHQSKAIMFGMPDANPARLAGFRDARATFGQMMSPSAETAPEVYWQDNVLRSSEASNDMVRLVHAYDGAASVKGIIGKADRSRIHVLHVELADEHNYLQASFLQGPDSLALKYAYEHPNHPNLPPDALRPKEEVDAAYANENQVLKWLADEFIPSEPGSRFVSSMDLNRMAGPSTGFSISVDGLRSALVTFLKAWGNDTFLPSNFQAEGHYLSRADLFQVLTDALAHFHRTGELPSSVKIVPVYGPVRILTGHGPNEGEVTVASVARLCDKIASELHDESPSEIPKNAIPFGIEIEGIRMNPAQFLKLMAQAIIKPVPDTKLMVRMAYMFGGPGELYPKTRLLSDIGFVWTLKPAPLETKLEARIIP
jgi:hypothetical protein